MGTGFLKIQASTGGGALPVANAQVIIKYPDGAILHETVTDANGSTEPYSLAAPDKKHTLNPYSLSLAYSSYEVKVFASGFVTEHVRGVRIVDTQTTILNVHMHPVGSKPVHGASSINISDGQPVGQAKRKEQILL